MKTTTELIMEAESAAALRGHSLSRWEDVSKHVAGSKMIAECRVCEAWVQIETGPGPNGISVGGPAVATSCPYSDEEDEAMENSITIDGEVFEVDKVSDGGHLAMIEAEGQSFYVAESSEKAGEASAEYWKDMAENDADEFVCIIGKETLVKWALGQYAGPGYEHVKSLEAWFELVARFPEQEWARYDGVERDIDACSSDIVDDLGFTPTVAYRCN